MTSTDGTRRQLSADKSAAGALQRAKQLDAELRADRGGAPYRTLGDLVAEYISTPRGRKRTPQGRLTGERWQPNHHASVTQLLTRALSSQGRRMTSPARALSRVDR